MTNTARRGFVALVFAILVLSTVLSAAQAPAPHADANDNDRIKMHATGTFDVKMTALPSAIDDKNAQFARFSSYKQFHGDLEGTSKGEMLSAGNPAKSAGYVAIERVTGMLKGRKGSFTLQHNATMTRGTPYLNIIVVPDSGTEELEGISGTMKIIIAADGKHSYDFEYSLPKAK